MNQSKELGKEFNISQFKLKLFTTLREKNMLPALEDISKPLATLELLMLATLLQLLAFATPEDILEQVQMLSTQQQYPLLEFIQLQYLLHHIKLIKQQPQLPPHLPINMEMVDMEVAESISTTLELTMSIQLAKVLQLEQLEPEAIMVTHQEDN